LRPENDVVLKLLVDSRRAAKVSQRELARRLRRTQSYISKIESGQQRLDVLEFLDYARAIGSEPAMLMLKLDSLTRVKHTWGIGVINEAE
jgi:transcriptional regulator with XRE-family HTH domain